MLVVEGSTDEEFFSPLCSQGSGQVFAAGTRTLVEQLFAHLRREPINGCECIFLVDCDGRGKTVHLSNEQALLVTETCDLEADLVKLGIATRVVRSFLDSDDAATQLMQRACDLAMVISVIRRAAHSASISMKGPNGRQLRIGDLPELQVNAWEADMPGDSDVLEVIAGELRWSVDEIAQIEASLGAISRDFATTCLGKDALDVLFRLLQNEGRGEVRGWNLEHFYKVVFRAAQLGDLPHWEVGRRLQAWETTSGHALLA